MDKVVASRVQSIKDDLKRTAAERDALNARLAGLAPDVKMIARVGLARLALDPTPEALGARAVEEDEQVFDVVLGHVLGDGGAGLDVGDAVRGGDFKHGDAGKLGDGLARVGELNGFGGNLRGDGFPRRGIRPAEFFDEQGRELEFLEAFASVGNVEGHGSAPISCAGVSGAACGRELSG